MSIQKKDWDKVISSNNHLLTLNLKEVWAYRDLLNLLVKRDLIAQYKQTILGPAWWFINPLFTTLIFTVIFGNVAGIPTDGIPPLLFYLAGVTNWNYFSDVLKKTSATFNNNSHIFGKVYFPRLVAPLSVVISSLLKYGIQIFLFLGFYGYFLYRGTDIKANLVLCAFPLLIFLLGGLGLAFGLLITSLTTKYRDLTFVVQFGVQLWMYATPIIYPLSEVPEKYQWLILLNPMTGIIETFKYGFLGQGTFSWWYLGYSFGIMSVVFLIGLVIFNWTERTFMDTV